MNTDSVAELTPSRAMLLQPDQAPEGTANQTTKARPPLDDHLHAKAKPEEPASAEAASERQGRDLNEVLNSSEPAPGDQVLPIILFIFAVSIVSSKLVLNCFLYLSN